MAIYENNNSDKADLAPTMLNPLIVTFGGDYSDYQVSYGGINPNYLRIETELTTLEQLTDFVDNFQKPIDPAFIQQQLDNAQRGLFIKRKFKTVLDKVEVNKWLV